LKTWQNGERGTIAMTENAPVAGFLLLLGLGFFFGLASEEFNAQSGQTRPSGIRSFPLLALSGVLSLASGGATTTPSAVAVPAILVAASSNNVLKAAYTAGFAGARAALAPAGGLVLLALVGAAAAWWIAA
jgi:hypothetical protein